MAFIAIVVVMIGITIVVWLLLRHKKKETILRQKQMDRIEAEVVPHKNIKVDNWDRAAFQWMCHLVVQWDQAVGPDW